MFPIMNFHLCTIVGSLPYKIKMVVVLVFYMRWHIDVQEVTDSCVKSYV